MLLPQILEKIALGVTLAAPPGPVTLEMIKRGLRNGFFGAFNIRLGGAIGNSLCLLGAFFGLSGLSDRPMLLNILQLLGAMFLIYRGYTSVKHQYDQTIFTTTNDEPAHNSNILNDCATGFTLSILNPVAVVFWFGIYSANINAQEYAAGSGASLLLNFCIIFGVLLWGTGLSIILDKGKNMLSSKVMNLISVIAGSLLILYGLKYGITGVLEFKRMVYGNG